VGGWLSAWVDRLAGHPGNSGSVPGPAALLADVLRLSARPAGAVGPWLMLALAGLALLWAGCCLAALLEPDAGRPLRLLATALLALVLQNLSVLGLSAVRGVAAGPLLAVAVALALALTPVGWRARAARRARRPSAASAEPDRSGRALLLPALLAGMATLAWYLLVVAVGLKLPDVGWDALAQHGAAAAAWLQHRGVYLIPGDDYWLNVYPMNTEVALLWQIALLHRDNLLSLVQLPYALLGALAAAVLARRWGAARWGAVLAGLSFLLVPNTIVQARTAYVDVAFGALFLTSLALWQHARGRNGWSDWLLFGLSLGLLAGTKPTGLLYGGVLGLAALLWPLAPRRGVQGAAPQAAAPAAGGELVLAGVAGAGDPLAPRASHQLARARGRAPAPLGWWGRLALCLLPALGLGLWWYGRTWLAYGNPVYPFPLSLGGHVLFRGPMTLGQLLVSAVPAAYRGRPDWYMLSLAWLGRQVNAWYVSRQGWLGYAWPFAELPALLAWMLWGARRADAWAVLAVAALLFLVQPHNWDPRYTLWLPALGAAALVALPLGPRAQLAAQTLLAVLAVVGSPAAAPRLLAAVPAAVHVPAARRGSGTLFDPSVYAWMSTSLPPGTRVGYAEGPTLLLPLFGPTFANPVTCVAAPTRAAWLRTLRADRIQVFVTQGSTTYENPYLSWMRGVPATPIHLGPVLYAWRLVPAPAV
jgi:predicted secreted protein